MTVTVQMLDELVAEIAALEEQKDDVEAALKELNKQLSSKQESVKGYLVELGRDSYESPHGKLTLKEEFNVRMPQDEQAKAQLWAWMREQGIYDRYATVHAVSLKSLFKAERELAMERGEDPITFALPGMEPATIFEVVKFKPVKN